MPVNRSVTLPVTLQRGGVNVLQIATPEVAGELTERNNAAIVSINGVRDRLRVLLVSGEPYPGERTWRNLLKSDSAVDLVHFTILRPPEKQDFVPVFELSLIAFPTQELFMEKVDEFDLIIFDRYKRRGILPNHYFENIARYVRDGGALLIASGDDFAGAESLYRSPLREILPVAPTARVIEEGFLPRVSEIGHRHPVTAALEEHAPRPTAPDGTPGWGRWFRMVEVEPPSGEAVMTGPEGRPLLVLDRQGEGRIADARLRPGLALEPRLRGRRAAARAAAPARALADEGARARGGGAARHRRGRRGADRAPHAGRERAAGDRDQPVGRHLRGHADRDLARPLAGPDRGRRERRLAARQRRPAGGRRGRPLGAEGVREPGLDRRRPRRRSPPPPAAGCAGSRTACPTSAWCARAGSPRAAAGSASPTATPTSSATSARSTSPRAG